MSTMAMSMGIMSTATMTTERCREGGGRRAESRMGKALLVVDR